MVLGRSPLMGCNSPRFSVPLLSGWKLLRGLYLVITRLPFMVRVTPVWMSCLWIFCCVWWKLFVICPLNIGLPSPLLVHGLLLPVLSRNSSAWRPVKSRQSWLANASMIMNRCLISSIVWMRTVIKLLCLMIGLLTLSGLVSFPPTRKWFFRRSP